VTITDIPDMLAHIELNVRRNAPAIQSGPVGTTRRDRDPRGKPTTGLSVGSTFLRNAPTAEMPSPSTSQGHSRPELAGSASTRATKTASVMARHVVHRHQPQVLVKPLRWGPPGKDIDALVRYAHSSCPQHPLSSRANDQPGGLPQNEIGAEAGFVKPEAVLSTCNDSANSPTTPQERGLSSSATPAGPPYDVIVGSDLIYYTYNEATPHSKLLLWTLRRVAGPGSLIYLALSLHHNPEEVMRMWRNWKSQLSNVREESNSPSGPAF
jgi:hypothetical protein